MTSIMKSFEFDKKFKEEKKVEHFDIYKQTKGFLNASSLKNLLYSPHAFHYHLNNQKPETDSMKFGTAVHTKLLEPDLFKDEYCCMLKDMLPNPDQDMRNGENKAFKKTFLEENSEKIVLTEAEWSKVDQMVDGARKIPLVQKLMKKGTYEPENSYYFKVDDTNWKGKIRVDYEHNSLPLFLDVKTSKDTSVNGFRKEHGNYDYALQIAYYYNNLSKFREVDRDSVYILAIGNTAPFGSALFHIPEEELQYGEMLVGVAMNRLKIAEDLGYFPGVEVTNYDASTGKIEDEGVIDLTTYFKRDFVV